MPGQPSTSARTCAGAGADKWQVPGTVPLADHVTLPLPLIETGPYVMHTGAAGSGLIATTAPNLTRFLK